MGTDVQDLTRFNEAIDQAVAESVAHYTKTINHSRLPVAEAQGLFDPMSPRRVRAVFDKYYT
jgi:hypothetical protein